MGIATTSKMVMIETTIKSSTNVIPRQRFIWTISVVMTLSVQ